MSGRFLFLNTLRVNIGIFHHFSKLSCQCLNQWVQTFTHFVWIFDKLQGIYLGDRRCRDYLQNAKILMIFQRFCTAAYWSPFFTFNFTRFACCTVIVIMSLSCCSMFLYIYNWRFNNIFFWILHLFKCFMHGWFGCLIKNNKIGEILNINPFNGFPN